MKYNFNVARFDRAMKAVWRILFTKPRAEHYAVIALLNKAEMYAKLAAYGTRCGNIPRGVRDTTRSLPCVRGRRRSNSRASASAAFARLSKRGGVGNDIRAAIVTCIASAQDSPPLPPLAFVAWPRDPACLARSCSSQAMGLSRSPMTKAQSGDPATDRDTSAPLSPSAALPSQRAAEFEDPLRKFTRWYDYSRRKSRLNGTAAADTLDAMVLATADPTGRPSARVVLFRGIRHEAFRDRGLCGFGERQTLRDLRARGVVVVCGDGDRGEDADDHDDDEQLDQGERPFRGVALVVQFRFHAGGKGIWYTFRPAGHAFPSPYARSTTA